MDPRKFAPAAVLLIVALIALVDDFGSAEAAPRTNGYTTQPILSSGYLGAADSALIEFAMIPGQPNQAVVASQSGFIWRVALDGSFAPTGWGDLGSVLTFNGEQGLMSVAFSPNFQTDGRVFVYYTPGSPAPTVLARYSATATDLNEASGIPLLSIEEFASNHNGGHIAFDSDGLLYLSLGDGGGGGDPREKGQALNTLLGKVIRIDVSGTGYTIPAGNPFNDGGGPIREEIFAYGFRNPWRMSIDPLTDDVWLGDVGQGAWEEVDKVVNGGNYGWDCEEGNHPFPDSDQGYPLLPCTGPFLPARAEYSHSFGQAVTGGVVYRGDDMPELYGWYVYGDFYSGRIWAVDGAAGTGAAVQLADLGWNLASFTLLPDGEIAIVTYNDGVHKLVADFDGDGVLNPSDNCPDWPNAGQGLPVWSVPADDDDCDGYPNAVLTSGRASEAAMGTNAADQCSNTAASGDEPIDAWGPDFNDTRSVNLSDLVVMGPWFNVVGPNPPNPAYNPRYDLNESDSVNLSDVVVIAPFFNRNCTP